MSGPMTGPTMLMDDRFHRWMEAAGVNSHDVRRVILDVPFDGLVTLYVERFADAKCLDVGLPDGLNITVQEVGNLPDGVPDDGARDAEPRRDLPHGGG